MFSQEVHVMLFAKFPSSLESQAQGQLLVYVSHLAATLAADSVSKVT